MLSVPSASLSIHSFAHSIGADCGFAALFGLALLVVLYFAHAREAATMRDDLDDAYERIQTLEQRIGQLSQQQAALRQAPLQTPGITGPIPVAARPPGVAAAALRSAPAATVVVAGAGAELLPAAAAGIAAPSLGSATKVIPDPPRQRPAPAPAPALGGAQPPTGAVATPVEDTFLAPAGLAAAAVAGAAGVAPPPPTGAAGVAAPPPPLGAPAGGGNGAPARVQIRPGAPGPGATGVLGAAVPGAPGSQDGPPRRTAPPPLAGRGAPPPQRSLLRRLLPPVVGLVIVGAIVVVLLSLTGGSTGAKAVVHHRRTTSTRTTASKPARFNPADWTVSVLNGTAVNGLAADVATLLVDKGYKQGSVTNAASQTETTTYIYYRSAADKVAAEHVARLVGLGPGQIQRAPKSAIESCATLTTGAASSCHAQLILSVGSDKDNLAASGTTTG